MSTTPFRNPHVAAAAASAVEEKAEGLPRLRFVTNDPTREYASRAGAVERLPDAVAALILCKTGLVKVERHQITIELNGEKLAFSSPNSVTIADKNGTGERVLWAMNRLRKDAIHILTADGAYVETIPRKGEGAWFESTAESKQALADARSHINRDMERMQILHAPETRQAAEDAQHNAAEIRRLVVTFPAFDAADGDTRDFEKAEAFSRAEVKTESRREAARREAAQRSDEDRRAEHAARTVGARHLDDILSPAASAPARYSAEPETASAEDIL